MPIFQIPNLQEPSPDTHSTAKQHLRRVRNARQRPSTSPITNSLQDRIYALAAEAEYLIGQTCSLQPLDYSKHPTGSRPPTTPDLTSEGPSLPSSPTLSPPLVYTPLEVDYYEQNYLDGITEEDPWYSNPTGDRIQPDTAERLGSSIRSVIPSFLSMESIPSINSSAPLRRLYPVCPSISVLLSGVEAPVCTTVPDEQQIPWPIQSIAPSYPSPSSLPPDSSGKPSRTVTSAIFTPPRNQHAYLVCPPPSKCAISRSPKLSPLSDFTAPTVSISNQACSCAVIPQSPTPNTCRTDEVITAESWETLSFIASSSYSLVGSSLFNHMSNAAEIASQGLKRKTLRRVLRPKESLRREFTRRIAKVLTRKGDTY